MRALSALSLLVLATCFTPQPGFHETNYADGVQIVPPPPDAGVWVEPPVDAQLPPDAGPPAPDHATVSSWPVAPQPTGPAPKMVRVPARKGCIKPGDPRIQTWRADAGAKTAANFDAALAAKGLHKGGVGIHRLELHRGIRGGGGFEGHPVGTVVQATVNGATGSFLAGTSEWSGNARHMPTWEMVTDARGDVWRLVRAPQPSKQSKNVIVCGCAQRPCGPYGSGCPACGVTSQTLYGPLPPGATFRGDIVVAYQQLDVVTTQEKGICQPIRKCPAPPP